MSTDRASRLAAVTIRIIPLGYSTVRSSAVIRASSPCPCGVHDLWSALLEFAQFAQIYCKPDSVASAGRYWRSAGESVAGISADWDLNLPSEAPERVPYCLLVNEAGRSVPPCFLVCKQAEGTCPTVLVDKGRNNYNLMATN